jgi:hypothetical protein
MSAEGTTRLDPHPGPGALLGAQTAPTTGPLRRASTWSVTTTTGFTVSGHLPAWADEDPSESGVPLGRLSIVLEDVGHRSSFEGQLLPARSPACEGDAAGHILWGSIDCNPYVEDPAPRVPVANVALVADYWINDLDPAGVADLAAKLRAQADRLDDEVRPALVAARADWAAHHRT